MKLSLGIVGLPNVGKSTLFNALTSQEVLAANYPFATIDPNVGIVEVHDDRLDKLAEMEKPEKIVPAVIEFVDIAGIVKGAHKGEGLGNQFLSNIREVDAIVQVVRAFENPNIIHVENKVDPKSDIEIINAELILKDLETIDVRLSKLEKTARHNPKEQKVLETLLAMKSHLEKGHLAFSFKHDESDEDFELLRSEIFLLTDKPVIFLINTNDLTKKPEEFRKEFQISDEYEVLPMDIQVEADIIKLPREEQQEYIQELGLETSGLQKLTRVAYRALGLISFFTAGKDEVRAWTIEKGETIKEAAAAIHNDFRDKFIAADVVAFDDYVSSGGWEQSKTTGKLRLEGKEYITKDGDIVIFKHGA